MTAAAGKAQPIIVIKKKGGHGGHHGGAWKVAYADFVTAMMSLFIVLWLMNSSEKIKKAVAGYFNDPRGTSTQMGTTLSGTGETVPISALTSMEQLKERLEEGIKAQKDLEKLFKQIEITITPEGLRIELLEDKNGTFYELGSPRLSHSGQELLVLLAQELKTLPNQLLIEGHTDATPYSTDAAYTNWELSADRANAARRLMQGDGVRADQVTQVRGYADQLLRIKTNPFDASNRRISILVKNEAVGTPAIAKGRVVERAEPPPKAEAPSKPAATDAHTTEPPAPKETGKPAAAQPPPAAVQPPSHATAAKPGPRARIMHMLPGQKK